MDNERLLHFLDRLERLSSAGKEGSPQNSSEIFRQIQTTVQVIKEEIADNLSYQKSLSSQSSYADTKLSVESVDAAKSGLASTVGIDDSSARSNALGFIDAIRLAALSAENGDSAEDSQTQKSNQTHSPAHSWQQIPPSSSSSGHSQHHNSRCSQIQQEELQAQQSSPHFPPHSNCFQQQQRAVITPSSTPGSRENMKIPMAHMLDDFRENHELSSHSLKSNSTSNSFSNSATNSNLSESQVTTPVSNPNSVSSVSSGMLKLSQRSKYFGKCFPAYRKLFRHETQPKSLLRPKGSSSMYPALSPDTLHMALVNNTKYQVFRIPEEYNEKPKLEFTGETQFSRHNCYVAMNNMWLVIASWDGIVLVVSLLNGNVLFRKNLRLQVTALDVSLDGSYIGVAVVKRNDQAPGSSVKQPLIYLICPSTMISSESAFEHPDIVSFSSPYQDFIRTISFNDGETALICTTEKESRIFVVSLANYREPRILMRSRRNNSDFDDNVIADEDDDDSYKHSEGLTAAKFLPNCRYILLSSHAPNTPPVILDTRLMVNKVKSSSGKVVQYLQPSGQQQNVVIRFEKMGSAIQSCIASGRGNGAAFVDYSGTVYAVNLPSVSTESRKIAVVFDLAAGNSMHHAPALRFSPDGTALIAVDRKGDIHIADFGAGHPQQPGIMKTKLLS